MLDSSKHLEINIFWNTSYQPPQIESAVLLYLVIPKYSHLLCKDPLTICMSFVAVSFDEQKTLPKVLVGSLPNKLASFGYKLEATGCVQLICLLELNPQFEGFYHSSSSCWQKTSLCWMVSYSTYRTIERQASKHWSSYNAKHVPCIPWPSHSCNPTHNGMFLLVRSFSKPWL